MFFWILFPIFSAFHIRHQLMTDKPAFGAEMDKTMALLKEARDMKHWNCSFQDGFCLLKSVYRK